MTFVQKLQAAVSDSDSTLCVGLDPNLSKLPVSVKKLFNSPEEQVIHFCKMVIDATKNDCAAYKPNLAFFEALGSSGLSVFHEVLAHIPENRIIIADAKRGDISTTAEHYKKSFFDQFHVDAITLNPLMGFETLDAFTEDESKGIYALALTSNPGADDFLKKPFEGFDMMAQYIASELKKRSSSSDAHLGMVIGATQAELSKSVTDLHKKASLLIPGIGAQGGSIEELAASLNEHEGIPLINSSRGIIYAGSDHENWTEHVAHKAQEMKEKLNMITERYV
ncbi:orotidine 5'-phosphate decarboxylase [Balneola sp. EhC07]|uniref:orotidine-5'-phosphate decarboxylase n=1 Tax=Balneola sp. EhC07 TaxID=1849360 RepID=UPI0007F3D88E|nr:orotidine-5'-phosphate decarboxylase [Balneola sp. EhC07]OAN61431.1 orotidine 5'-phosphate decarboxylase [Balneola sp. EhC07]